MSICKLFSETPTLKFDCSKKIYKCLKYFLFFSSGFIFLIIMKPFIIEYKVGVAKIRKDSITNKYIKKIN